MDTASQSRAVEGQHQLEARQSSDIIATLSGLNTFTVSSVLGEPGRSTLTIEYSMTSICPHILVFEKLIPPVGLGYDPSTSRMETGTTCVPEHGQLVAGQTHCQTAAAINIRIPQPTNCEVKGTWTFFFRTACANADNIPSDLLSNTGQFSPPKCADIPADTLVVAAAGAAGGNPCTLAPSLPTIAGTISWPDGSFVKLGGKTSVDFLMRPSSALPAVTRADLIKLGVVKSGRNTDSNGAPRPQRPPGTAFATELLAESPLGYQFPGFVRKLGRRSNLIIKIHPDFSRVTVGVQPNMATSLDGAWAEPSDLGGNATYELTGSFRLRFGSATGRQEKVKRQGPGMSTQMPAPQLAATIDISTVLTVELPQGTFDPATGSVIVGSGTTIPPTPAAPPSSYTPGLSVGAIIGICFAVVVGIGCIAGLAVRFGKQKKIRKEYEKQYAKERLLGSSGGSYFPSTVDNPGQYAKLVDDDDDETNVDSAYGSGTGSKVFEYELDNVYRS